MLQNLKYYEIIKQSLLVLIIEKYKCSFKDIEFENTLE